MEIRKGQDFLPDEVVAKDCQVHLERLDDYHWQLAIYGNDGEEVRIDFIHAACVVAYLPSLRPTLREADGAVCVCSEFVPSAFDPSRCAVCRKTRPAAYA